MGTVLPHDPSGFFSETLASTRGAARKPEKTTVPSAADSVKLVRGGVDGTGLGIAGCGGATGRGRGGGTNRGTGGGATEGCGNEGEGRGTGGAGGGGATGRGSGGGTGRGRFTGGGGTATGGAGAGKCAPQYPQN